MSSTWTDDDRLREDDKSQRQRLLRINAAIAKRDTDRAAAERVNRAGAFMLDPAERQELLSKADADCATAFDEEENAVEQAITKQRQRVDDIKTRSRESSHTLTVDELTRAELLQRRVSREVA